MRKRRSRVRTRRPSVALEPTSRRLPRALVLEVDRREAIERSLPPKRRYKLKGFVLSKVLALKGGGPTVVLPVAPTAPAKSSKAYLRTHKDLSLTEVRNAQVCSKRKIRREVIHAKGVAGNSRYKRRTVTVDSSVRC